MRRLSICSCAALLAASSAAAQPASDLRTEQVVDAALRQQIAFWLTADARRTGTVVCVSVEQGGVARSASKGDLDRFRETAVRPGADCEVRAGGAVERSSGRPAVLLTIGAVSWRGPDEAVVTVRYFRSRLSSSSQELRVVKEQERWLCLGPIVRMSPA